MIRLFLLLWLAGQSGASDALQHVQAGLEARKQHQVDVEIAEFRNYQQLGHELVEVSEQICRLRPVEETLTPEEKKLRKRSAGKSRAK